MANEFKLIDERGYVDYYEGGKGPPDSFIGKYYTRLMIGPYVRTRPFEVGEWKPNLSIFLPIPIELTDDTYVNFSETNLGTVGNLMNNDLATGAGAILLNNAGNILGGLASAGLAARFGAAGTAAAAIASRATDINNDTISSALQQQLGMAPNPNPSVQFTGPDLREFNFSWTLYPKTKEMSDAISKVIQKLKAAALPSKSFSNSTAILSYPDLCQINFYPWDSISAGSPANKNNIWGWTDNSIIKIKRCFIKNIRVNYSEQGNPSFFAGTQLPTTYRLNITLQETEYMLSEDWGGTPNYKGDQLALDTFVSLVSGVASGLLGVAGGEITESILNSTLGAEGADPAQ